METTSIKKFKIIELYPNCNLKVGDVITFLPDYNYSREDHTLKFETVQEFLYKFFVPVKIEDYKFEYSNPDKIGSVHWFNTVVGFAGRATEFMIDKPEHEMSKKYPQMIKDVISDLFSAKQDGLIKLKD